MAAAVQFFLTVGAGVGRRTPTEIAAGESLLARPAVEAGVIGTRHGHDLAVLPVEPLRTRAGVIVLQILQNTKTGVLMFSLVLPSKDFSAQVSS